MPPVYVKYGFRCETPPRAIDCSRRQHWWSWRQSKPRPKTHPHGFLRAYSIVSHPNEPAGSPGTPGDSPRAPLIEKQRVTVAGYLHDGGSRQPGQAGALPPGHGVAHRLFDLVLHLGAEFRHTLPSVYMLLCSITQFRVQCNLYRKKTPRRHAGVPV